MALCRYRDVQEIIAGDPFMNNGVLMENAVANALYRKGCPLYYHSKRNSTLEVDFVMKYQGKVCIMEVKSGRNKRFKSLSTLLSQDNRNRMGVKVCGGNIERDRNGALHLVTVLGHQSEFYRELFPLRVDGRDVLQMVCPLCGGTLVLRKERYGMFCGCSNFGPKGCKFTRKFETSSCI